MGNSYTISCTVLTVFESFISKRANSAGNDHHFLRIQLANPHQIFCRIIFLKTFLIFIFPSRTSEFFQQVVRHLMSYYPLFWMKTKRRVSSLLQDSYKLPTVSPRWRNLHLQACSYETTGMCSRSSEATSQISVERKESVKHIEEQQPPQKSCFWDSNTFLWVGSTLAPLSVESSYLWRCVWNALCLTLTINQTLITQKRDDGVLARQDMTGSDAGQLTWSGRLSWSRSLKMQTLAGVCFLGPQTYCSVGVCLCVHVHSWLHRACRQSISLYEKLETRFFSRVINLYLVPKLACQKHCFLLKMIIWIAKMITVLQTSTQCSTTSLQEIVFSGRAPPLFNILQLKGNCFGFPTSNKWPFFL